MWRTVVWRPEPTRWSSGVFLRDMRRGDGPLPTVLALWPGGLSRVADHSPWIHRATAQGWQVLVMDTAAEGALLPRELGTSGMYIGWGTLYKLNAYLMQLGDSLCALRTRDVLAAVEMLHAWPEADPAKTVDASVEVAVQINGKVRAAVTLRPDEPKDEAIAKANPHRVKTVDANGTVDEVWTRIWNLVLPLT